MHQSSASLEYLSIIVEWANVTPSSAKRCQCLLWALRLQVTEYLAEVHAVAIQRPVEILIMYDERSTSPANLAAQLVPLYQLFPMILTVRPVAAGTCAYYLQKNIGVQHSRGTINIFVDSDVIPDVGWLEQILAPFASPRVQVVSGHTYVEPTGVLGKAFALCWFHPKREPGPAAPEPCSHLFANNLAMRRSATAGPPFQRLQGDVRGSCAVLAAELKHNGVEILRSPGAGASHTSPETLVELIVRALAHGRDLVILSRHLQQYGTSVGEVQNHRWRWLTSIIRIPTAVSRRFRLVDTSVSELPIILAICALYYGVVMLGALATALYPERMLRWIKMPGQPEYLG
jgi:hypothetical protein